MLVTLKQLKTSLQAMKNYVNNLINPIKEKTPDKPTIDGMYIVEVSDDSLNYISDPHSNSTNGTGVFSTKEGTGSASGNYSHAEGSGSASGNYSHAEGFGLANGVFSHAEGFGTARGEQSHAEGSGVANGNYSHAEGFGTADALLHHVFGAYNIKDVAQNASNKGVYIEIVGNGISESTRSNARTLDWSGNEKLAGSITLGMGTANETTITAQDAYNLINSGGSGSSSNNSNILNGYGTGSLRSIGSEEDDYTKTGANSIALGFSSVATGANSFATNAANVYGDNSSGLSGGIVDNYVDYSHADSCGNVAGGEHSHADSGGNVSSGDYSHVDSGGFADADYSHADSGGGVFGEYSHAECGGRAYGDYSYAGGYGVSAMEDYQHVFGKYNASYISTNHVNAVEIVGNGSNENNLSNARTLDWLGNERLAGSITLGADTNNEVTLTPQDLADLLDLIGIESEVF